MRYNIAFLHVEFPSGGAERATMTLAAYLRGKGCRICVICRRFDADKVPDAERDFYDDRRNVFAFGDMGRSARTRFVARKCVEQNIDFLIIQGHKNVYIRQLSIFTPPHYKNYFLQPRAAFLGNRYKGGTQEET